jgi:hypothetical protein
MVRAHGGDRFALALISLALDEVDATGVLRRHGPRRERRCVGSQVGHDCERWRLRGNATAATALVSRVSRRGRPG